MAPTVAVRGLGAAPVLLGFSLLPMGRAPAQDELRTAYLRDLRRYEGVRYVWAAKAPSASTAPDSCGAG